MALLAEPRSDTNRVFSPCSDASVQRSDGFSFGIAFSSRTSFFLNNNNSLQLSPCDRRLSLSSSNSQLALFRPKVDEISILTINTTSFSPGMQKYHQSIHVRVGRKAFEKSFSKPQTSLETIGV
ncbi:hypothetical protein RJ639_036159 [Escallonia herrerae]|uniref:Uncharacterized protein n=1 Tax=Escallonia herrerae TaxID=1293975 RepID=A0AA88WUT7_9ASTE|nr:hypothetical protein RJ639_036159 [Escallonia herrerae]